RVPITEAGPDVQPAAGPGGTAAGADFHGFSIDGLGLSNPLGLLPEEALPGLQFTNTGTPTLEEAAPPPPPPLAPPIEFAGIQGIVEEEDFVLPAPEEVITEHGQGNEDPNDADLKQYDTDPSPPITLDVHLDLSVTGGAGPFNFHFLSIGNDT